MVTKRSVTVIVAIVVAGFALITLYCSTPEPTPDDNEVVERPTSDEPVPEDDEVEDSEHDFAGDGRPKHPLELTFIDAGQAHALLIQKDDLDILVDAGDHYTGGLPEAIESVTEPLEYMVITHPHFDHYGGADDIIGEFEVEKVITNGERRGSPRDEEVPSSWETFTTAIDEARLKLEAWDPGHQYELSDHLTIEVLASGGDFENTSDGSDINNSSLVLMVHYAAQ